MPASSSTEDQARILLVLLTKQPALDKLEIAYPDDGPDILFHDLHRTAATISLQQDVHPKKVRELPGHSTIVLTLDTCSHIIPSMHSETADKIDSVFG